MYYIPVTMCKLIINVVAHPWECILEHDPTDMCQDMRKIFDAIRGNLYFDVITHPVKKMDSIVFRTYITVVSKDPELVLGVVDRAVLKDMLLTLYFTDEFGDVYSLDSVSFRTIGTEGLFMDSINGD